MPAKGSQGKSREQLLEARDFLQAKIDRFVAHIEREPDATPSKEVLVKFFPEQKDRNALWKRLEQARKGQPTNIQQAWDTLKSLRGGSQASRDAGEVSQKPEGHRLVGLRRHGKGPYMFETFKPHEPWTPKPLTPLNLSPTPGPARRKPGLAFWNPGLPRCLKSWTAEVSGILDCRGAWNPEMPRCLESWRGIVVCRNVWNPGLPRCLELWMAEVFGVLDCRGAWNPGLPKWLESWIAEVPGILIAQVIGILDCRGAWNPGLPQEIIVSHM